MQVLSQGALSLLHPGLGTSLPQPHSVSISRDILFRVLHKNEKLKTPSKKNEVKFTNLFSSLICKSENFKNL